MLVKATWPLQLLARCPHPPGQMKIGLEWSVASGGEVLLRGASLGEHPEP